MGYKSIIQHSKGFVFTVVSLSVTLALLSLYSAEAATLSIPKVKGKKGEVAPVQVEIRNAQGLAGLKLVLVYNKEVLAYKSYKVSPLLKDKPVVVNSREPGQLIFVMAGAEGIKEQEGTLVTFDFNVITAKVSKEPSVLELVKVEMLDEKIKPVSFTIENGSFELSE